MPELPWNPLAARSPAERAQLDAFRELLLHFNQRINLISRDTEGAVDERHLLHALALTYRPFPAGSVLVDWGTGGGLPAIPVAIACPDVTVHAVDAVGKKIQCVQAMARRLGLANLHPWHGRAEAWPGIAHFSISRATAPLSDLWRWHRRAWDAEAPRVSGAWPPGLLCLKGGDLRSEIAALQQVDAGVTVETLPLEPLLGHPYFADKVLLTVCAG